MKALIAGSTGLIGGHLLAQILECPEYKEVTVLLRHPEELSHPKLKKILVDFEKLDDYAAIFEVDAIFSCLGTTKSKTKDADLYFRIEHDYPASMARLGKARGLQQFHYISSMGADANSRNSYTKNKGLAEQTLSGLSLAAIHLYRPSLLLGDREEIRFGEKVAGFFMKLVKPLLPDRYKPINATFVARAMLQQSLLGIKGKMIYDSGAIAEIAALSAHNPAL